ncbi:class I SAM-dependent methyltransferase [Gordonia sp. ABSL11-1]|uniref:O-methyltransferase n=1 Tax=Gordonia sp. ABSL11-1 TaxID=3053924 RepID=UPI0025726177|nr:class I SAM-dependent methyltransferase [Gordonia sp. ABSL11-1]MDL9946457.1 class I SAM-dependent methyltransferase [Gordonia sp. ABSL11-1]
MTTTLDSGPVAAKISALYDAADAQRANQPRPRRDRTGDEPLGSAAERADAAEDRYLPISPTAGRLMYSLIRATRPAVVVEFGMSYGISTLHLAAAVRDNGFGRVYTTELSTKKIAAAAETFVEVGLDDVITILDGDALVTLTTVPGDIGFVLMDGWKEMYLPVLQVIEPRIPVGSLIVADNTEAPDTAPYLGHVRSPENGYTSINFPGKDSDTMELSCRV